MRTPVAITALLILCLTTVAVAQAPDFPQPTKEHQWLRQFDGQWETHAKSIAYGAIPAMECDSTMKSRTLGEFWMILETKGDMDGVEMTSIQTLGYDPKKKKYVGTWVDSMTHYLFHYEGTVDKSGKKITLEAEGPSYLEPGKTAKYRDSYEFKTPDLIIAKSEVMGEDGKWVTFATAESRRKK